MHTSAVEGTPRCEPLNFCIQILSDAKSIETECLTFLFAPVLWTGPAADAAPFNTQHSVSMRPFESQICKIGFLMGINYHSQKKAHLLFSK